MVEKRPGVPAILVILLRACRMSYRKIEDSLRAGGYEVSDTSIKAFLDKHEVDVAFMAKLLKRGTPNLLSSLRILEGGIERNIGIMLQSIQDLDEQRSLLVAKQRLAVAKLSDIADAEHPENTDAATSRALVSVLGRLQVFLENMHRIAGAADWNSRLLLMLQFLRESQVTVLAKGGVILGGEVAVDMDSLFEEAYARYKVEDTFSEDSEVIQ